MESTTARTVLTLALLFVAACAGAAVHERPSPSPAPQAPPTAQAPPAPPALPALPKRETVRHILDLEQGTRQSPISIFTPAAQRTNEHSIVLDYGKSSERVANKGHTIEVDYDPGSSLTFDGRTYDFKQFHFHTPSEHVIDGEQFPMEMHMVHTSPAAPDRYLVLAVLFREGARDRFLDEFIAAIPQHAGTEVRSAKKTVDVRDLFSKRDHHFVYDGSLTTPPFTEHVKWLVRAAPRTASRDQIAAFHKLEGDNARHLQPGRAREVEYQ